jgi:hypothetical protein
MGTKKLPIGKSDFKNIIEDNETLRIPINSSNDSETPTKSGQINNGISGHNESELVVE